MRTRPPSSPLTLSSQPSCVRPSLFTLGTLLSIGLETNFSLTREMGLNSIYFLFMRLLKSPCLRPRTISILPIPLVLRPHILTRISPSRFSSGMETRLHSMSPTPLPMKEKRSPLSPITTGTGSLTTICFWWLAVRYKVLLTSRGPS
ncbi:hypothetical protein FCV25MIE_10960 [Fagus crenata]